ncbi:MAG: chemotaxis protein CheW [Desulfobacula sp.]|nr:chemotaxis protein CheW [Desulfobacula sp.]
MKFSKLAHQSQCVTFRLDHNMIGINILDIREIIPCKKITHIARSPQFVSGLMNLRGQILTILDIGVLLGLESRIIHSDSYVIVFKHKNIGFIVDKIGDVVGIEQKLIEAIPANIDPAIQEYMEHIVNLPDEILMLLNAKKVLSNTLLQSQGHKES